MEGRKITITMEEDLQKKLREIQAASLPVRRKNLSFSKLINESLRISLEKREEITVSLKLSKNFGLVH